MKKQSLLRWSFILIMISIPWIYLANIWNDLPEQIPVHFGPSGEPDEYGPKNKIFFAPVLFTGLTLLMYILISNIYKLDPKRFAKNQPAIFRKIALAIVVFLCCACLFLLYWTVNRKATGINIFLVMMGLLFAYMGNLMHSIKPNYFAGFRLPWTLESEDNWRKTHLLAGKLWFAGGISISILAIFIKPIVMIFLLVAIVLTISLIPAIYSYRYFKKEKLRINST